MYPLYCTHLELVINTREEMHRLCPFIQVCMKEDGWCSKIEECFPNKSCCTCGYEMPMPEVDC